MHPVTCSLLWVRCPFDLFSISDFGGKWPIKRKFSKISSWIPRWDTEIRFIQIWWKSAVAKLPKGRMVYQTKKKLALHGTRPSPHFGQNGPIAPKIPSMLSPLDMSTYNEFGLDRLHSPDLFRKDWFFGPKSQCNIGFQPTITNYQHTNTNYGS